MTRVHFVCIGNCCRSQMAEGFTRHSGAGVIEASSSGLSPTREVAWETVATMKSCGVDLTGQYPKKFDRYATGEFDLIVNMSGFVLPGVPVPPVEDWPVHDPYGESAAVYRRCAAEIQGLVDGLIDRLRLSGPPIAANSV